MDAGLAEYGMAGAILAILLPLFVWVVRKTSNRAVEVSEEFTHYLREQGTQNTAVLTKATQVLERTGDTLSTVAKGLDVSIASTERHEDRAQKRHEDLLVLMERMTDDIKAHVTRQPPA